MIIKRCAYDKYHNINKKYKVRVKGLLRYQVVCTCGARSTKHNTKRKAIRSWVDVGQLIVDN